MPDRHSTARRSIQPELLEEAARASQDRAKEDVTADVNELLSQLNPHWQGKFRVALDNVAKVRQDENLRMARTIQGAIQANIDAIKTFQNEEREDAVFEDDAVAMARSGISTLSKIYQEVQVCKTSLRSTRDISGPLSLESLEKSLDRIVAYAEDEAMLLREWIPLVADAKAGRKREERTRKSETAALLRKQICSWLRLAQLGNIEFDPGFEETAMEFAYADGLHPDEGAVE